MADRDDARDLIAAYRTVHSPDRDATLAALTRLRGRLADDHDQAPAIAPRRTSRVALVAAALAAMVVLAIGISLVQGIARERVDESPDPQATYQGTRDTDPSASQIVSPHATTPEDPDPVAAPDLDPVADPESKSESDPDSDSDSDPASVTDTAPAPDPDPDRARWSTRPRPKSKAVPDPDASLHAEMALLGAAQSALAAGNPERALKDLDRHKQRFPGSLLAEEREVARIQALCDLGRLDKAAAALKSFKRQFPGSPLTGRANKACERAKATEP